jgi:WD40 repeat protein
MDAESAAVGTSNCQLLVESLTIQHRVARKFRDPNGFSIRHVVSLGFGVVAVSPVVRLLNAAADTSGDDSVNPFAMLQPGDSSSASSAVIATSIAAFGATALVTCNAEECHLWNAERGVCLRALDPRSGRQDFIASCAASWEDRLVCCGFDDGVIRLWDVRMKTFLRQFRSNGNTDHRSGVPVRRLRLGPWGARKIFVHTPSDESALKLFQVGYEREPVWQSASELSVQTFDVGFDGSGSWLHTADAEKLRRFTVTNLVA